MKNGKKKWFQLKTKRFILTLVCLFLFIYLFMIVWHTFKPLPEGVSYASELRWTDDIEMLTDLTYAQNKDGDDLEHELSIFPSIYKMIDDAEDFIVLDLFMLDHYNDEKIDFPEIAQTLTRKLVDKKVEKPQMRIVFITDPINKGYGSYESKWFTAMEDEGIEVVYTDLNRLRDSTPIYSGLYRTIFQWADIGGDGWIPNAMSAKAPKMKLASYMTLLNVKANHRKTVITEKEALITSSNPHNASGFHGNVGLKVKGEIINDILKSEEAIVHYTNGGKLPRAEQTKNSEGDYAVQYVTEKKILETLLEDIAKAQVGDNIKIGMFYIAQTDVVAALIEAVNRGVTVKMILDPNENAFGNEKSGIPNRPVAQEMMDKTDGEIQIRWYNTINAQYHTKLVVVQTKEETFITNGSANLTDRTLNNYNLEANLRVIAPNDSELVQEMYAYFNRIWENDDAQYTLDFEEYQNEFTFVQRGIYRLQEWLKLTTY